MLLQYFDSYLHRKNILEYPYFLVTNGKFMILDIEGVSNVQFHGKNSQSFENGLLAH